MNQACVLTSDETDLAQEDRLAQPRMHASVSKALAEAEITKGHAALLQALPERAQESILQRLLALPSLPSAEDVRRAFETIARPLEAACFDAQDCATCRYNSDVHAMILSPTVARGMCVNNGCWDRKEAQALDETVRALKRRQRVVRIVPLREAVGPTHKVPAATGDEPLGTEQLAHCQKKCEKFGAVVETGNYVANVVENVCTDLTCHQRRVQAHLSVEQTRFRNRVWRHAVTQHFGSMLDGAQRQSVYMALSAIEAPVSDDWKAQHGLRQGESLRSYIERQANSDEHARRQAFAALLAARLSNLPEHYLRGMLQALHVRIEDHWRFTPSVLEHLTLTQLGEIASDWACQDVPAIQQALETGRTAAIAALTAQLTPQLAATYVPPLLRITA